MGDRPSSISIKRVVALAAVALAGCGSDVFFVTLEPRPETDAGSPMADAGPRAVPLAPVAPANPAPPEWPCPFGWNEMSLDTGSTCEPWPNDATRCPDGELRTPGSPTCRALDACPPGDFAPAQPGETRDWFVRPGSGGDGSEATPFGSIAAALAVAAPGESIFLSRGTFDETVVLTKAISLVGTCSSGTAFDVSGSTADPTLRVSSPGVKLRGFGVHGGLGDGLVVEAGADVQGENLRFSAIPGMAISVTGGAASLTGVDVTDCGEGLGTESAGVRVRAGGQLTLQEAQIERSRLHGVLALDENTSLTLQDVAIRDTRHLGALRDARRAGEGAGLWIGFGAGATVKRSAIERNARAGIQVASSGTLDARDMVVRDSVPTEDGNWGVGIFAEAASVEIRRALLDGNVRTGLRVDERTELAFVPSAVVEDVVIQGTRPRPQDGLLGNGLKVTSPDATSDDRRARLSGARLLLLDNHNSAVASDHAVVDVQDLEVRGTRASDGSGDGGTGWLVSGGEVRLTRARFLDNQEAGVYVDTPGSEVILADVTISDTRTRDTPRIGGRGIATVAGTSLELHRAFLARNYEASIAMNGPSQLLLEDVSVEDTFGRPDDGLFGVGLSIQSTQVRGARVLLARSRQVAAWVGRESTVSLTDLAIDEALPQACASDGCPAFGIGVGAYQRSVLDLHRFGVSGATLCGVQIAAEGELDLVDGTVSHNTFGACVNDHDFAVERLSHNVVYDANVRNIESSSLPIPDPSPPLILSSTD